MQNAGVSLGNWRVLNYFTKNSWMVLKVGTDKTGEDLFRSQGAVMPWCCEGFIFASYKTSSSGFQKSTSPDPWWMTF